MFRLKPSSAGKTVLGNKPYASLKLALIADELTQTSLEHEVRVKNVTPSNFQTIFGRWCPDLLFVESAWQGYNDAWKYKIASYPGYSDRTNKQLRVVVEAARRAGIPTVFWNKEDDVHYLRFIESAKLFDYIFTVDENCLPRYRQDAPAAIATDTLMFPVQSCFHYPDGAATSLGFSCFVGSYGTHVHPKRRLRQDMLFAAFARHGLDIYDRNSSRKAAHYRYPRLPGIRICRKVAYPMTANLYRGYKFNLNVNTIESSPTMYSRRLIEILASGGVAISTPSLAALRLFNDYCHIVDSRDELDEVLNWSDREYEVAVQRAKAGADLVLRDHTWTSRLQQIESLGIF